MHDMSNTRKEIAARLGFAAGNGAKAEFGRFDTELKFLDFQIMQQPDLAQKNVIVLAEKMGAMSNITKDEMDGLMRAAKWLKMESQVKSAYESARSRMSRSGAKAKFAPQIDEAEQELKAWTKKLGYYPDMAKVNIRPNTVMLWFYDQKGKATQLASKLRSVAASMNLSPSAITSEEGRHPAYDGGAARDVGQVTVDYNRSTKASRPGTKTTMTREQTEEQKAGLKIMSAADPAVGAKIAKLIKEGKPQDQAVAIALDMKRRGEL